ncbi:hypothetical protein [Tardiphaga sp. 862_B3_N1_1]|uniref:hypothetical protein n=1 Tax=Tardiphaga sp. 862_B3_N1_1 TaxID=3240763 RepID=UPI003F8A592B
MNFGQVVQPGPDRQSVEFTYIVMPGAFIGPDASFAWPGIVLIMAPTPMRTQALDAGHLYMAEHVPSIHVSLEVTRAQFSDMLPMFEAQRLKSFNFTLKEKVDSSWPIYSWGMSPISLV